MHFKLVKLFVFAKPCCRPYSSTGGRRPSLGVPQKDFYTKYFTTTCSTMTGKTALFIVAEGSEELELVAPVDILRRANVMFTVIYNSQS